MKKLLFSFLIGLMATTCLAIDGAAQDSMPAVVDPVTQNNIAAVVDTLTVAPTEATGFFGAYKPDYFLMCYFFALLGIFVSVQLQANKRDVNSNRTPTHFSYRRLFLDNYKRVALNMVILYLALRFMPDLSGIELSEWKAVCAGLGFDQILLLFRKKK